MNPNEFQIKEGTINFWVKAGKINYTSPEVVPLMQKSDSAGNSILVIIDSDKKIKLFHVFIGLGRTDIEADVSKLNCNEDHMFTFTWSISKKEINIFIDGMRVANKEIVYSE